MKVIAAVDENWAIGRNGDQLIYISEDLKHFKALTFPGGRPLKGRRNLILSRNPGFAPPEAEVFSSLEELLAAAPQDAFVIGGASVYQALLDRCDTACITRIEAAFPGADCWFPNLDERPEWKIAEEGPVLEEKGVRFRYVTYVRA